MNIETEAIVLGHVCIDDNVSEHKSYRAAGGPAVFICKTLEELPGKNTVTVVAPYGEDFLSVSPDMTKYPARPLSLQTLGYQNVTRNGARTQRAFHYDEALPIAVDDALRKKIGISDMVIVAPLVSNFSASYVKEIRDSMNKGAFLMLLPQGYFRQFDWAGGVGVREFIEAPDILPLVDLVVVSEQDHPEMVDMAAWWAWEYRCAVVVTRGEKGAAAVTKNGVTDVPTKAVPQEKIVDSVGAGDVFAAALAWRFSLTGDLIEAVYVANIIAGQSLAYTPDQMTFDPPALL